MRMTRFLVKVLSTKTAVWVLGIAFIMSQTWIIVALDDTGPKLFQLQTVCLTNPSPQKTGAAARQMLLQNWTAEDAKHLKRHFILDYWIHPLVYGLALSAVALNEFKRRNPPNETPYYAIKGGLITLFMVSAALCDVKENSLHSAIQFDPLDAPDSLLWHASLFATLKWVMVSVALAAVGFSYTKPAVSRDAKQD